VIALGPPTHHGALEFHWLGRVSYAEALELQSDLAARRRAGEISDTVLLLEHEPVYTIGRTPDKTSLAGAAPALPHPVVEISRGGQATYHGPGQLIGYPILDLQLLGRDLHAYLRALEEALIATCAALALDATARPGLTGVWIESRKLASIGVGVRHWVSLHGFALNVTEECLAGFHAIVPCGIIGVEMTCLERELGRPVTVPDLAEAVQTPLGVALGSLRQRG
jgi:lipoyl(octanoyl) transferase